MERDGWEVGGDGKTGKELALLSERLRLASRLCHLGVESSQESYVHTSLSLFPHLWNGAKAVLPVTLLFIHVPYRSPSARVHLDLAVLFFPFHRGATWGFKHWKHHAISQRLSLDLNSNSSDIKARVRDSSSFCPRRILHSGGEIRESSCQLLIYIYYLQSMPTEF